MNSKGYVCLIWAVGYDMFQIGVTESPSTLVRELQKRSRLKLAVAKVQYCEDPKDLARLLRKSFQGCDSCGGKWIDVDLKKATQLFDRSMTRYFTPKEA